MKSFLLITGCIVVLAIAALPWLLPASGDLGSKKPVRLTTNDELLAEYDHDELDSEIRIFCSQCHGFPEPALFDSKRWPAEIDRAFGFHRDSGKHDVPEPDSRIVLAWYQKYSEPKPPSTEELAVDTSTVLGEVVPGPMLRGRADISSVTLMDTAQGKQIYTTGMIFGRIRSTQPDLSSFTDMYKAKHPARIRACDLNPDCEFEYLISDLGTPTVTDDLCGRVLWMQNTGVDEAGKPVFDVTVLAEDFGRVADARSVDFDGDGDHDVVVAEFGWDHAGSIILLENDNGTFKRSVIDERHGAVEIQVADFDADGKEDFVVIFGQEFESVELFRNVGGLEFEQKELYHSPTPAFGISSLTLFDHDNDGDLDVLFTSGDMYDGFQIQSHHGLYMLTNNGDEFPMSLIANQDAVMCAKPGDIDGDGDIDFVACSFMPQDSVYFPSNGYPSLVLYECTADNTYLPHVLKAGDCSHPALELADLDDDGDLDVIVGSLHDVGGKAEPVINVWKNTSTKLKQVQAP